MKFNRKKFAKAISDKMIDRGISLRDVQKETGVSFSTISRVKSGKEPDVTTLILLLDWLCEKLETYIVYTETVKNRRHDNGI